MGKAAIRECRFSRIVKANTGYVEKKNNDGHSLPLEGKVASGASRIGHWRHEKERERSSQVRRLRKHPSAADAVPFPQWGRQRGGGFAAPKGSQPRLAALGSPFQGKGLAWTLPPSYGRRCPEGAEVGWGEKKRYEREREIVSSTSFARALEHRYPHIVRANTCMCGKTIPPTKPSPRGEGGERSEPDRALAA